MKKTNSAMLFSILLGLSPALASYNTKMWASPTDSTFAQKTEQANYIIARYVIGSGGVIGAKSPNYFQHSTAGQTIVGGAKNANNFVVSGFWILPAGPT